MKTVSYPVQVPDGKYCNRWEGGGESCKYIYCYDCRLFNKSLEDGGVGWFKLKQCLEMKDFE